MIEKSVEVSGMVAATLEMSVWYESVVQSDYVMAILMEVSAMSRISGRIAPIENIGLVDRFMRFPSGTALMVYGVVKIILSGQDIISAAAILLAVYPLMTTCMGWDPIYQLFGARSCSPAGGRNQCGTFPYELDSALGHEPMIAGISNRCVAGGVQGSAC